MKSKILKQGLAKLFREVRDALQSQSARSAGIYVISLGISIGVPFLLLPILTRYIEPSGYGTLSMLQALITLTSGVASFGLRTPLLRKFSITSEDGHASYLASCLCIMTCSFAICVCVATVLHQQISVITNVSWRWMALAMAAGFGLTLGQVQMTVFQARNQAMQFAGTQIFFSVAAAAGSFLLVVGLGYFWAGRAFAICTIAILVGIWALLYLYRYGLLGRVTRKNIVAAASFGLASIPFSLSTLALPYIDRFVLRSQFSLIEVGIYALAAHLAQGFISLCGAFNLALVPWMYHELNAMTGRHEARRLALRTSLICAALLLGAGLFYAALGLAVPLLFSAKYQPALIYFPWLVAGAFCQTLLPLCNAVLVFYQHKRILSATGVLSLVCSIVIIAFCVMKFGTIGAAIGMFISRAVLLLLVGMPAIWLAVASTRKQAEAKGA
jgi:O-antigen/teichoic acid export membrane protein